MNSPDSRDRRQDKTIPRGLPPGGRLRRRLNIWLLTLYGLGTTIGAGIFVLIGEITGKAGAFAPLSFAVAAVLAAPTALCFAELCSRFPKAAGEAVYVRQTLKLDSLARLTGYGVVGVGIISSAAITDGFISYVQLVLDWPDWVLATLVLGVICSVGILGIEHSVSVSALLSVVEIGTLLVLSWLGLPLLVEEGLPRFDALMPGSTSDWSGILSGAVLAFFAFIGFEDMVNVAEEVENVERTMPRAIVLTLCITLVLYLVFSLVAGAVVGIDTLGQSATPLSDLVQKLTGTDGRLISLIVMIAIMNGVLIQMIMASRVLYGLAELHWLPAWFGRISARRRVPVNATVFAAILIWLLAVALPIDILARSTSSVTLMVFALINAGLLVLPKTPAPDTPVFIVPRWVCVLGLAGNLGLLGFQISRLWSIG